MSTAEEREMLRLKVKLAQAQNRKAAWESFAEWLPLIVILAAMIAPVWVALVAVALGADLD